MEEPEASKLRAALGEFQQRLRAGAAPAAVVRESITHGSSAVLDGPTYALLREYVGSALSVSPNRDVYLVGSAKLGFSIKPRRRYGLFGDDSDVDLAVVSPAAYERL